MTSSSKPPLGLRIIRIVSIIAFIIIIIGIGGAIAVPTLNLPQGGTVSHVLYFVSQILDLVLAVILVLCISRRNQKMLKISKVLLVADLLLSLISVYFSHDIFSTVVSVLIDAFLLSYLAGISIWFYDNTKTKDDPAIKKSDKVGVWSFAILVILFILFEVAISLFAAGKQSSLNSQYNAAFQNKTSQEAIAYCQTLPTWQSDICIVQVAEMANDPSDKILQKQTPLDATSTCSLVSDAQGQGVCYDQFNATR